MTRKAYGKLKQALTRNKGGLHRALHVPEGQKIPAAKLSAALKSKNPHVRAMANLAKTAKGFRHGGKRRSA
jgi:hypothetical protein